MNKTLEKNYITSKLVGRTGNLMFQIAHGYSKSIEYNRQYVAPLKESDVGHLRNGLFRKIDFIEDIPSTSISEHIMSPFHYSESKPSYTSPTVFFGYYQSEKYFDKHTEIIKSLFSPTDEFYSKVYKDFPFLIDNVVAVINVRRGDYLSQPRRHPVISIEYINEAIKLLPHHDKLLVISDDIEWCKMNIKYENAIFNEKYWNQDVLWLMSLCDHFIISNSSFSWWGAYLSKNEKKTVIAPDTWVGPDIIDDMSDVIPKNWIKLPTEWNDGILKFKPIDKRGYWVTDNTSEHKFDTNVAEETLKILNEKNLKTLFDAGCGPGEYTKYFTENGIECICCDGNPFTPKLTNGKGFVLDLSKPFSMGPKFDCVFSLEVGEHTPAEYESIFIRNLVDHSKNFIVLSWATIGQGGYGHFNERPNEYIENLLLEYGYVRNKLLEERVRINSFWWWFRNTIMIFER